MQAFQSSITSREPVTASLPHLVEPFMNREGQLAVYLFAAIKKTDTQARTLSSAYRMAKFGRSLMCSTRFATTLAYRARQHRSESRVHIVLSYPTDTYTAEFNKLLCLRPFIRCCGTRLHRVSTSTTRVPFPCYPRVHLLHNIYQYPTPSVSCDVGHFVYMRKLWRASFFAASLCRVVVRTTPRSRARHL